MNPSVSSSLFNLKNYKNREPVLLVLWNKDITYTKLMGGIFNNNFSRVSYCAEKVLTRSELAMKAAQANCRLLLTTSLEVLKLVAPAMAGTLSENYGTVVEFDGIRGGTCRLILVPTFMSMYTQNAGPFILNHYCQKLAQGGMVKGDKFSWEYLTPANFEAAKEVASKSFLCAVDIETSKEFLRIESCAYTFGIRNSDGSVTTKSFVVRCAAETYPFCLDAIAVLNATSVPKVMQNGQYDCSYFIRWDLPIVNYIYDTQNLMHCLFPELPKDLSFVSGMFLENFRFWKDESSENLYEYNAKDTYNTFWTWLGMNAYIIRNNCEYAWKNYLIEFPVIFPAISCGQEGFAVDEEQRMKLRAAEVAKSEEALGNLRYLIGEPNFNPKSPKQVAELMRAVGYKLGKGTDVKELTKWKDAHPMYEPLVKYIWAYRKAEKAISTYYDMSLLNQRLMYELNPAGTETGRMSSKGSNFWVGTNIQNIPRYARAMLRADDGWILVAVDKSQSESYCTGYISQDLNLIKVVTTSPDFHCQNASMFFGMPFEELFDADYIDPKTGKKGKVLIEAIRTVAKRVNHGANYNMGPDVLVETMGVPAVLEAQRLLKLPAFMKVRDVAQYLLNRFDDTYPIIRGPWYNSLIKELQSTGKLYLASTGWTRRSFLKPWKSKLDLNAVVAHKPQSLSVQLVNKAFVRIWRELQLGKYKGKFRMKAQVHDEIIVQVRPEIVEQASKDIADLMVIPTVVEGRTMTIPSTIATGFYWSEAK